MKKLCISLLLAAILLLAVSCTTYWDSGEEGAVFIAYSKLEKAAFAEAIFYEAGASTDIVIPDNYRGYPIEALGGYRGTGVPSPFGVIFAEDEAASGADSETATAEERYVTAEEHLYDDFFEHPVVVEDVHFHITLPAGLKKIMLTEGELVDCREVITADGSRVIYVRRPVYAFSIVADNPYFYTKDGRLYERGSEQPVPGFIYDDYDAGEAGA